MSIFWQVLLALIAFFAGCFALYWLFWGGVMWWVSAMGDVKQEAPKPYVPLLKRIDRNSWIAIILFAALVIAVNVAGYIGSH